MPKKHSNTEEIDKKRFAVLNEKLEMAMNECKWDEAQKIATLIKTLKGGPSTPKKTSKQTPKQKDEVENDSFDVKAITTTKQKVKNKIQECANGSSSGKIKTKEVIFVGTAPSKKEAKIWKQAFAHRENIPRPANFNSKIICEMCKTELTERNRTKTIFDETNTKVYRCHKCKHNNNI